MELELLEPDVQEACLEQGTEHAESAGAAFSKEGSTLQEIEPSYSISAPQVKPADPLPSNSPEHADPLPSDLPKASDPPATLSKPPEGADPTTPSDLPEPPEEPLQSDCCGTGCSPCVFDIYEEDLKLWRQLAALTPEERAVRMTQGPGGKKEERGGANVALSPQEYRTFEITGIQQVSQDSHIFTFGLPSDHVLGVGIGQHAVLRVKDSSGHFLTRQYTPISEAGKVGSFELLIKLYEHGRMSRHITQWRIGSKAEWRGPFGEFSYRPNQYSHIGMLACGTGIAPMIQVARAVVENEEEETFVHCLYACRTQHDILLKPQLDHFSSFWNFTITYALSQSTADSVSADPGRLGYGDRVHHGRISREVVESELSGVLAASNHMLLICGTKSFDKDMINFLHKMDHTKINYFKF